MERTAIGIDIGGTHLRAARVAADGTILARAKAASAADPKAVLKRVEALIAEVRDDMVAGIGIGVPGRVDFPAKKVLSGGYVDLSTVPLAERIEQKFGLPVMLDNDCGMALLAEAALGAAKGVGSAVMLTIGTGIGGAILDNGKILRGRAAAGQLGHVCVDPAGLPCVCGKRGCVETESSGTALGRHIAEAGLPSGTTAAQLLAQRNNGDAAAADVLRAWAAPLRVVINSLVATLDPETVVLGGGLGHAAFQALSSIPAQKSWYESQIVPAALGDDAGVIGAALAVLPKAAGKRLLLVNGVPASGKSSVALALSEATGWPVLALDTVKNPFLAEIEGVDRPFNRRLGRASLRAMLDVFREAPAGSTFILDAWFGFQPREWVEKLLAEAGAGRIAEIWCTAPPEVISERYRTRAQHRLPGHPGADYAVELVELAKRAEPLRLGNLLEVDTVTRSNEDALKCWAMEVLT